MSKRFWGSARLLVLLSLAILAADAVFFWRWTTAAGQGVDHARQWVSYAAVMSMHAIALTLLSKCPGHPRATGAALVVFGLGAFWLMGASVYYLVFKPEALLLGAAGILCAVCSPSPTPNG